MTAPRRQEVPREHPAQRAIPVPVDLANRQTYEDLRMLPEEARAEARKGFRIAAAGCQRGTVMRSVLVKSDEDGIDSGTRLAHLILVGDWWYHYHKTRGFRAPYCPPISENWPRNA